MTAFASQVFADNAFPEGEIKGNAPLSQVLLQPDIKAALTGQMIRIKIKLLTLWPFVIDTTTTGKTQHTVPGYFNAQEWLQFAELHMRHHLWQKQSKEAELARRVVH